MENLFPQEVENIGLAILNDDLISFKTYYKKNIKIEERNLLIFIVQNGAFSILTDTLVNNAIEYKKLSLIEKRIFFIQIFTNKYFIELNISQEKILLFCMNNFPYSKELLNLILLDSLKYASNEVIEYLISKRAQLSIKKLKELLIWCKHTSHTFIRKNIINEYLVSLLPKNKNNILGILCLSISKDPDDYCLEIDIFENLKDELQQKWIDFIVRNNNLEFYLYSHSFDVLKKDGFNRLDLNIDFMYFLTYYIVPQINKLDTKNENLFFRLIENFENDNFIKEIGSDFIKSIKIVMLTNKLKSEMKIQIFKDKKEGKIKI